MAPRLCTVICILFVMAINNFKFSSESNVSQLNWANNFLFPKTPTPTTESNTNNFERSQKKSNVDQIVKKHSTGFPIPENLREDKAHFREYNTLLPSSASIEIHFSQTGKVFNKKETYKKSTLNGTQVYNITTTWDNQPIDHSENPIRITLDRHDAQYFKIIVDGKFYNDSAPPGPPRQAFYGLWDYEVAEVFFLNGDNQYVEIELGPYAHYLILLLDGQRNTIRHSLLLNNITSFITANNWSVVAFIPLEYLPPNVTRMNAYAIHGTGDERVYESLYPVVKGTPAPDFHNLCAFKPFDQSIITSEDVTTFSQTWHDSLESVRTLNILNEWSGQKLPSNETAQLNLSVENNNLEVIVGAPFYKDSAPNATAGPFETLGNYEVVHLFLNGTSGEYLELQFGPWDHYMVAFWSGSKQQRGNHSMKINYTSNKMETRWNATAVIPLSYLPPNVTKCNAHLVHGPNRTTSSLYPGEGKPDFHNPDYYRAIDFEMLYPDTQSLECSPLWYEIYSQCGSGVAVQPIVAATLLSVLLAYINQIQ